MPDRKKRMFGRISFRRHVELDFSSEKYRDCQIENLSLTGMFVIGTFKKNVGEYCLVKLFQTGVSSDIRLLALAHVVRTEDEGIAIEFASMSFDSYMFLQVTLLYEAEEPLAIGLELPEECPFEISEQKITLPEEHS